MQTLFYDTSRLIGRRLKAAYSVPPHSIVIIRSRPSSTGHTRAVSLSGEHLFLWLEGMYYASLKEYRGPGQCRAAMTKARTLLLLKDWLDICCEPMERLH